MMILSIEPTVAARGHPSVTMTSDDPSVRYDTLTLTGPGVALEMISRWNRQIKARSKNACDVRGETQVCGWRWPGVVR